MKSSYDIDLRVERAASQIRSAEPDAKLVEGAAARVWAQLTSESAEAAAGAAEIGEIRGCEDYQALLPAFLAGSLPEARRLLVEDHTRECVPCRRALVEAREGRPIRTASPGRAAWGAEGRKTQGRPYLRWAIAAVLVAGLGAALYFVSGLVLYSGPAATVQTVDGKLFRVTETAHLPVTSGEDVRRGEVIRTGRDGGAVVRLKDGSLVELKERSEISVRESHAGTTIDLDRGNVIVQAAPQRNRQLFVSTDDCDVAVTGTIFSVNHGMKGSRVSVIEGEVHVMQAGEKTVLRPGEMIATHAFLGNVPVEREIGWSRDVDTYIELLKEYRDLRRRIDERVPTPELRYDTRLLDLMPEDTVFFVALPNLSETVAETHRVIQEQVQKSPVLAQWWRNERQQALPIEPMIDDIVAKLSEFGDFLGDELAIGVQNGGPPPVGEWDEDFSGPVVLARIVDAEGFRDFLERELEAHQVAAEDVVFLEDPFASAPDAEIYLWLHDELVAGSPDLARLRQVASFVLRGEVNPFVGSEFHQRIAELYSEGVNFLIAADLEDVIATAVDASEAHGEGETSEMLSRLGVLDVQHLMAEQKKVAGKTQHRAVLTFSEARRGLTSWLAEPAPMGALDFISAEAKLFGAFVLKDPEAMLQDLASFSDQDDAEMEKIFDEFEIRLGLDLNDFIEVLGGEIAFAVDGPLLPMPSWKLIMEVYDPARFQFIVEQTITELNTHLREHGEEEVEIVVEEVGGRTFYMVPAGQFEVHYTFVEGYFVAAASRALLDRAIRSRNSGYTITEASRFRNLLPADGQNNFSALVYQDLSTLLADAAQQLGSGLLTPDQQKSIDELAADAEPTLGYAYAEPRRIIAAAESQNDLMSTLVEQMLGLENPMGFTSILSQLPLGP